MTTASYESGWYIILWVGIAALGLTAIGGKFGIAGVWLVAALLAVFALSELVSYYTTGSFKTIGVSS